MRPPLSLNILFIEGTPWCGAKPQVPVHHLRVGGGFPGQPFRLDFRGVHGGMQRVYGAQPAAVGEFNGLLKIRHAAPLRSRLEYPAGLPYGFRKVTAVADGQATGLFAVYVLARFCREYGCRGMPAVACGNQHGINVFALEQFTEVAIHSAIAVAVMFVHKGFGCFATACLDIRHGKTLDVGMAEHLGQHIGAARPHPDNAQGYPFARGRRGPLAQHAGGNNPGN